MQGSLPAFHKRLLTWFDRERRELPWRIPRGAETSAQLDPYHVLVSEAMLQQTQVATVVPYFQRFCQAFPTIADLAAAPEQQVLRLWQGLGYYSRARNLHAAANKIVEEHGGKLPGDVEKLRALPGVGRYTAGAVASIAFGLRVPILDGNVMRVLCRLDGVVGDPRERAINEKLWERAEEVLPRKRVGDFNSALMELGAMVCTPRNPKCLVCPLKAYCTALAEGVQEKIPAVKTAKPTPVVRRTVLCLRDGERWLMEQRPGKGRWASMWQFVTVASEEFEKTRTGMTVERIGEVAHALTHRRYRFEVFFAKNARGRKLAGNQKWMTVAEMGTHPMPRPHLRILEMVGERSG